MTRRVCTKQATTNQPLLASLFAFERAQHGLLACHCTMKHTHNRNTREGRQKNQAGSSHGEQHTQYSFNENEKKKEVRRRQDSSTSPSEKKKAQKTYQVTDRQAISNCEQRNKHKETVDREGKGKKKKKEISPPATPAIRATRARLRMPFSVPKRMQETTNAEAMMCHLQTSYRKEKEQALSHGHGKVW